MSLTTVRNLIVSKLNAKLSKPVIQMEQTATKPPYPYVGYKIIVAGNSGAGSPVMTRETVPSTDINFVSDIKETAIDQSTCTFSFSTYCATKMEADEMAIIVKNFVEHALYFDLKDAGAVVVEITAIGDRTTLITNVYEYRSGFDAIIRMATETSRTVPTIEEIIINMEE
ncbi:MAG: hypothetical protein JJE18_04580 [Eubacteriaceae bacterium]|nr:hypothetical protein [Eubacteriaceae bacterium]